MGKNFLKRQTELNQKFLDVGEDMGVQKMVDYLTVVLRDPNVMRKDVYGKERLERILNALAEVDKEFCVCFTDDKDADVYQERLDKILKEAYGDNFSPFYERYPFIKQMKYRKPKKGWV